MKRILINIIVFFSILFFPWWVAVFTGVVAVLLQRNFYEIMAWGVFYDLLYGTASIHILGFSFFFTAGAFILFYGAEFLKTRTRLDFRH